MAKLLATPYPFPKYDDFQNRGGFEAYHKAANDALAKIPDGQLISFTAADGYAYYYVVSLSPLVIQHIDYMDGYKIPSAFIRGLRTSDVKFYLADRED